MRVGATMPIYKRCSRCGKRLPSGTKCECIKKRHKEYDKYTRDKVAEDFYHSKDWELARDDAISFYTGIDIYSYYVLGAIEYGTTVHHIVPLKDDWSKRADRHNLIYLTDSNHQLMHKAMREGRYKETIELLNKLANKYEQEFST